MISLFSFFLTIALIIFVVMFLWDLLCMNSGLWPFYLIVSIYLAAVKIFIEVVILY